MPGQTPNLRGVNCNPGSDPDDMVALRMSFEESRIITIRQRLVMAINDIQCGRYSRCREQVGLLICHFFLGNNRSAADRPFPTPQVAVRFHIRTAVYPDV